MTTFFRGARRGLPLAGLASAALLAGALSPAPARADTCWIGFRSGANPVSIDGVKGGTEWNDASVLESGSGCLNRLIDNAGGNAERDVRVYTKRDAANLYFLFEVGDGTNALSAGSFGEKLVLHLDPNHDRTPLLNAGGADFRYEFTHRWSTSSGIQRSRLASGGPAGFCPGFNEWSAPGPWAAPDAQFTTTTATLGAGWTLEIRIPLADIGLAAPLANDIGLAFAIVNDLGTGVDYSGTRFPQSLPFTTAVNPMNADETAGCSDWLRPSAWGGGYHNQAPADVTMDHAPVYWLANSVQALNCNDVANWDYHPSKACKIKVRGTFLNGGGAPATRNILYLWGVHDAGTSRWTFLGLKEGQAIPAGSGSVTSDLWDAPSGLPGSAHPCVRVYVLPAAFRADFTKAQIMAINNATSSVIADLENKYGLQPIHSAQRNISRLAPSAQCPSGSCPSVAMGEDGGGQPLFASLRLRLPRLGAAPLYAQERPEPGRDTLRGREVKWSDQDEKTYGQENVAVQVRTYGWQHPREPQKREYRIVEEIGGAVQMIPVRTLMERKEMPLTFNVTAPDLGRYTILPLIDQHVPAGVDPLKVGLSEAPIQFEKGETRELTGVVAWTGGGVTGGTQPTGGGRGCPLGGSGAAVAMFGLVGLGAIVRFLRRR